MQFETERLILRPWQEGDVENYLTLAKDVGYTCFTTPGFFSFAPDDIIENINKRLEIFKSKNVGRFLLFEKESQDLIGTCGLMPYLLDGKEIMELGYRLRLKFWEKGFATEAAQAVLKDGFGRVGLTCISAFVLPQNKASIRVINKLKFQYLNDFMHANLLHQLYELTKVNWR
jgi:RimJ/RimL family protein N-acetyltransferase